MKFRRTFAFDFRISFLPLVDKRRTREFSRSLIHLDVRAGYNGYPIHLFNGILVHLACRQRTMFFIGKSTEYHCVAVSDDL